MFSTGIYVAAFHGLKNVGHSLAACGSVTLIKWSGLTHLDLFIYLFTLKNRNNGSVVWDRSTDTE